MSLKAGFGGASKLPGPAFVFSTVAIQRPLPTNTSVRI